jgi:hypothetical protein
MAETKVKLTSNQLGETREYEITHAQRILSMQSQNGGDWSLDDKHYTLNTNGTIEPASTGKAKGAKAEGPTD